MKTWHYEIAIVATWLAIVTELTGEGLAGWIGALAVLLTFGHVQVADRLAEAEARATEKRVHCERWLNRYLVGKEALWVTYFVAHRSWAALAGTVVFLAYPAWRRWRRRVSVPLAFLVLTSCATIPTGHPAPVTVVEAVEQSWREAGLPACHLGPARVNVARDATDFLGRCHAPAEAVASCLDSATEQRGLRAVAYPVAVLRPGIVDQDRAARHEFLHWCVMTTLDPAGDPGHQDLRVWERGGPGSAEQRARRLK